MMYVNLIVHDYHNQSTGKRYEPLVISLVFRIDLVFYSLVIAVRFGPRLRVEGRSLTYYCLFFTYLDFDVKLSRWLFYHIYLYLLLDCKGMILFRGKNT